ncbi:MAG TPA: DHA2 family efflux MFS transporter permease subunit [Bacilli bacterium]|nr:DHA2 family efflux MFS transporter permease subunit [Bacilli bacterium]
MSSTFTILYILFAVVVLIVLNRALMRRGKKAKEPSHEATTEPVKAGVDAQEAGAEAIREMVEEAEEGETTSEVTAPANSQAEPNTPSRTERQKEAVGIPKLMAVLLLGAFVAILNQTLINVAIPKMMSDLNVSANVIQWLVTGYMLVNGVMIPITAFLIERFGTRKLFLVAMSLFTVGALICAVAPSFEIMLTGRLVQASGAGIIMPLMMTVFLTVFPPQQRGKAMGVMGIAMIFAPAIGPTLSGYIVEHYNWRLLFYIVLPIGLLDILLATAWMADVTKKSTIKFDAPGFIFSSLGFGGLLYAFSEAGSNGWASGEVVLTLMIGIISLVLFVWRELTTDAPMLDLRVFKFDIFTLTTIIGSIINMAMFAAMILLPIYLQNIRGFTPLESGLLLLPGAIIMGVIQPIAGAIFDKIGARLLAIVGLIVTVLTTWQFSHLTPDTTYGHILLLYCLRMAGMALMMMTIMTAGMNQLPRRLHAHGTATSNTARQVAGSLGTALLVTVMTNRQSFHLASYGNEITTTNPFLSQHVAALGHGLAAHAGLPAQAGTPLMTQMLYGLAAKQSAIDGINDAFMVATGIAALALLLAFFIKHVRPSNE